MSIVHSPIPPPRNWDYEIKKENDQLRAEVAELREKLRQNQLLIDKEEQALSQIRTFLQPLYSGLTHLFEQMDSVTGAGAKTGEQPRNKVVWDSWKQKLGGQTAEAIDVLMLHGEMNAEQLRIHLRCARTHVYNVISRLNKAGIINKNGGRISLKEL